MKGKTISIIGVTGLIGSHLYELLKEDKDIETIRLLVRRPMPATDPRTEIKLVDFTDAESFQLAIDGSNVVFCAVGTTQKKVKGDKEAYRKVDYDIPVNAARFCKLTGCDTFVLVSSVGANSKSNSFYLKLKGEVEEAIKAVGLRSVHIMRPSLLLGDRKESRFGERFAKAVMKIFSFLVPAKYKAIEAKEVAKAMAYCPHLAQASSGTYEYKAIKSLSNCYEDSVKDVHTPVENKPVSAELQKYDLKINIIEFVDDSQPGFVKCSFQDIDNKEWFFIEKAPVVSSDYLDEKSKYPQPGTIDCYILNKRKDNNQKEVLTIELYNILDDSFEERGNIFDVYSTQIQ